jgi:hypothetical protein
LPTVSLALRYAVSQNLKEQLQLVGALMVKRYFRSKMWKIVRKTFQTSNPVPTTLMMWYLKDNFLVFLLKWLLRKCTYVPMAHDLNILLQPAHEAHDKQSKIQNSQRHTF